MRGQDVKQNTVKFQEQRELQYQARLEAWRRTIQNDRAQARAAINAAMTSLKQRGIFSSYELNKFYSQMWNGVAMPGEFGTNTETGGAKVA